MWEVIEYPPQPFGECTLCKRHTCGEYTDDEGNKQHKWVYTNLEMDKGSSFVIGINCVENMADNLGVTKKVVEKVVKEKPSVFESLEIIKEFTERFQNIEIQDSVKAKGSQRNTRKRGATT